MMINFYLPDLVGGINVTTKKSVDASSHEMWEATIIVGDEDGTRRKRRDHILKGNSM